MNSPAYHATVTDLPDLPGLGGGRLVLVTGATGYIGGRLIPELLEAGFRVRALARDPRRLRDRPWAADVEVVQGDATDLESLHGALDGVEVAYYLLHSLATGSRFEALDRETARTFGRAARECGVERIVYLGGLHPDERGALPAPGLPARGRRHPARQRRADHRAARRRSSSARGPRPSRCCATSPSGCR